MRSQDIYAAITNTDMNKICFTETGFIHIYPHLYARDTLKSGMLPSAYKTHAQIRKMELSFFKLSHRPSIHIPRIQKPARSRGGPVLAVGFLTQAGLLVWKISETLAQLLKRPFPASSRTGRCPTSKARSLAPDGMSEAGNGLFRSCPKSQRFSKPEGQPVSKSPPQEQARPDSWRPAFLFASCGLNDRHESLFLHVSIMRSLANSPPLACSNFCSRSDT